MQLLAAPTLTEFPPTIEQADRILQTACTMPPSFAGVPALAQPVPVSGGRVPASLQLIGPSGSEEALVAAGLRVEEAIAAP